MQLAPHFSLAELTVTSTGLDNTPPPEVIENLEGLAVAVLQPIRDRIGAMKITSGYRSPAVNRHPDVRGSSSSDHLTGWAADFVPLDVSQAEAFDEVRRQMFDEELPVDQLMVYPKRGHLHVGMAAPGETPRRQVYSNATGQVRRTPDLEGSPTADTDINPDFEPPEADMADAQIVSAPLTVPPEAVEDVKAELKRLGTYSIAEVTTRLADGRLTKDEADELLEDLFEEGIDGAAHLVDVVVALPEPWESTSDLALQAGAAELKKLVAPYGARIVTAVDDFVGPNLGRLDKKIPKAAAAGNLKRVARLEDRVLKHFPDSELAATIRQSRPEARG